MSHISHDLPHKKEYYKPVGTVSTYYQEKGAVPLRSHLSGQDIQGVYLF